MNPERWAAFRKTFGPMSTGSLRAIAEGRKATNLSPEALAAIRHLLAGVELGGVTGREFAPGCARLRPCRISRHERALESGLLPQRPAVNHELRPPDQQP